MRTVAAVILCLLSQLSMAQFRIGPVGGLNYNRQVFKSNSYRYEGVFRSRLGFNLGIISDLVITDYLSLQSELLYTQRAGYYKTDRLNVSEEYKADLSYVALPVCLTYKLDVKSAYLLAGAGVYLSRLMNSSHNTYLNGVNIDNGKLDVGTDYVTDEIKPWDAGVKVKAGFELKKGMYMVGFYDIGTADVNPRFTVTRNKTFGVQLGYIFSLTEEDRYNRFENFYQF